MKMDTVRITYFSDILCVWAYLSQIRYDELIGQFSDRVSIDYRYFQVFGNVREKLHAGWEQRGGIAGYAAHVQEVAAGFEHVKLHADVWVATAPESSMPGHLFLCAIRSLEESGEVERGTLARAAWTVRDEFFTNCSDVASRPVLLSIGERVGIAPAKLERLLDSGIAHAELSSDLALARDHFVRASPTLVLNEGRQQLTGNVGYRVIEANVRELLERPEGGHSWC
jgi:predicted DsbA family dithiol-disulfide isomerase